MVSDLACSSQLRSAVETECETNPFKAIANRAKSGVAGEKRSFAHAGARAGLRNKPIAPEMSEDARRCPISPGDLNCTGTTEGDLAAEPIGLFVRSGFRYRFIPRP
jgi:hypothetical protein